MYSMCKVIHAIGLFFTLQRSVFYYLTNAANTLKRSVVFCLTNVVLHTILLAVKV